MTIITNYNRIVRPIECIVAIYTTDTLGLVVEYEDRTGMHRVIGVKKILR